MMKILIKWQEEYIYIFQINRFKSSTGAEGVIRSPCFWLLTRQSVRIHDLQFSVDFSPVSDRDGPLFGDLERGQIQSLHESLRTREYAPLAVEPSEGRIQAFDCIRCVESLPDV